MITEVKNSQDPKTLRVEFMIGNTCNHKCWYCFPGSNEGDYRWTTDFETTTKNFFHLLDHYKKNGKERFEIHIVGGEPTLWPKLGEFIKLIKEKYNSWILVSTNGSRTIRWWKKYGQYFDSVALSVHHEYVDINHIIQVADTVYKKGPIVNAMVLMDPFAWDKCVGLIEQLKSSKYKWFINAMEVMHTTIDYTPELRDFISNSRKRMPNIFWLL